MSKYSISFGAVGAFLPVAWIFYYVTVGADSYAIDWLAQSAWFQNFRLMLWPSSLLLIADPNDANIPLWITSVLLNVGLYAVVGCLVWLSLHESKL